MQVTHSTVNGLFHTVTVDTLARWLNATTMNAGTGTSGRLPPLLVLPLGALWPGQPGLWPARRSARCWSR